MVSKLINLLVSTVLLLIFTKSVNSFRAMLKHPRDIFCQLDSCSNPERHVLCLYPDTVIHERCKYHWRSRLNPLQKRSLLEIHNGIKIKYGARKKIKFPKIEWDDTLALMAQRWADQCEQVNDECRSLPDCGFVVKQNVALYYMEDTKPPFIRRVNPDLTTIVNNWAYTQYNMANPASTRYRDINRIGCGLTISSECDYDDYNFFKTYGAPGSRLSIFCVNYYRIYVVCNYAISRMRCASRRKT